MAKWNTTGSMILGITWSLAIEEQFYLALPILIRLVRRSALPYVFVAGIVLAPLVRLFIVYHFRGDLWATYVLLPCRMDSLFLGALCAYGVRQPKLWDWLVQHRKAIWLVLLALIAGMPPLNNEGIPFTILWLAVGVGWMSAFYGTVLILALVDSQSFLGHAMRRQWLAGLGAIGLSVYLFHVGIYCFCNYLLHIHGWHLASWQDIGVTVLALAITIGFGTVSWRYFEKPIVRWGHHRTY
jgi:peptidoglycan/LPS O-acetylase OafA/YrhL